MKHSYLYQKALLDILGSRNFLVEHAPRPPSNSANTLIPSKLRHYANLENSVDSLCTSTRYMTDTIRQIEH